VSVVVAAAVVVALAQDGDILVVDDARPQGGRCTREPAGL
jgi:hypothetical protein